jgi:ribA/ribD-fused uncharacterized protein
MSKQEWKFENSVVFSKTKEKWGGLSNMAAGSPIVLNGVNFFTSEHLYQALRFVNHPEVQRKIVEEKNPMKAKWISRANNELTREDWNDFKIKAMWFSICMKYLQNPNFRLLLSETGDMDIVELSKKDDFWGAYPVNEKILIGDNVLGLLLMRLREKKENFQPFQNLEDFKIFGETVNIL